MSGTLPRRTRHRSAALDTLSGLPAQVREGWRVIRGSVACRLAAFLAWVLCVDVRGAEPCHFLTQARRWFCESID